MERRNEKQGQDTNKIVDLFAARKAATQSQDGQASMGAGSDKQEGSSFLDEIRKNAENIERLRQERLKANQGVLKSYRIKN